MPEDNAGLQSRTQQFRTLLNLVDTFIWILLATLVFAPLFLMIRAFEYLAGDRNE